jgi:hypothetical protein
VAWHLALVPLPLCAHIKPAVRATYVQSRASSRMSERQPRHAPAPLGGSPAAPAGGASAGNASPGQHSSRGRSQLSEARSNAGGSRHSEQFEECSTAGGTASTDTGIGSDVSYARRYLQNQLHSGTQAETALAQRVAKDAKSAVVTQKLMIRGMGAAMEVGVCGICCFLPFSRRGKE